jgi:hypothetical protein
MDYRGNSQFFLAIKAPAELEETGDSIFRDHQAFMSRTHHRDGDKALLQYTVSKLVNDDGTVTYLLYEVYQTDEGVADHIEQARADDLIDPFHEFLDRCEVIGGGPGTIVSSLW